MCIVLIVGLDLICSCIGVGCGFSPHLVMFGCWLCVWTSLGHVRVLVVGLYLIWSCMGVDCGVGPHLIMAIILVVGLDLIWSCS